MGLYKLCLGYMGSIGVISGLLPDFNGVYMGDYEAVSSESLSCCSCSTKLGGCATIFDGAAQNQVRIDNAF